MAPVKKIPICALKHRVQVCRMEDVVVGDVMTLTRVPAIKAWASIEPKQSTMFSLDGFAIKEPKDRQTHLITMRFRRDIDISVAAWVYEERMQSGDRWFKVLGIKEYGEDGNYMVLSCRLVERGDVMSKPEPKKPDATFAKPMPDGVRL